MMVSAIRRHPRRCRASLPEDGLLGLRRPPGAVFGGVVAGSARVRAGEGAGMAEAALPQRPAATRGVRGQVGPRFPPESWAREGGSGACWEL